MYLLDLLGVFATITTLLDEWINGTRLATVMKQTHELYWE